MPPARLGDLADSFEPCIIAFCERIRAIDEPRVPPELRLIRGDANYRLWVNDSRTILVRLWDNGGIEVATRETPDHTWGPPVWLREEKTS